MSCAELDTLTEQLRRATRAVDRRTGEARALYHTGAQTKADIATLTADIERYAKVAAVLTAIADERQLTTQTRIESLVTQGLRTIFGDELSFHLVPSIRAKTPVVDFVVRSTLSDGTIVDTDVMEARGGGLAATVGFLLRLVVLLLSADRQDTVLFLDETFAHVSAEYEPRLAEFIREIVDKTGVQIILVTHSDAFSDAADVRYRFELRDGVTHVKGI